MREMRNNFLRALVFSLAFGAFLFHFLGCQGGTPPSPAPPGNPTNSEPEQVRWGGVFRRAFSSPILTLDPREIEESNSHEVCRQIFEGLFEFETETKAAGSGIATDPKVIPSLVATWSNSLDRLTYIFKLRNDCRFHATWGPNDMPTRNGGRLVTAEDIEYTFHRLLTPDFKAPRRSTFWVIKGGKDFSEGKTKKIEGIRILASDTISFTLERPFAPFLSLLALNSAFIVPREDVEFLKNEFHFTPVGAGAFYWAGKKDDTIIFKPNRNYFRGKPYLDAIEFHIIKDEADRFEAFKKGFLAVTNVPDPEYKNVLNDPALSPYFQEVSNWGTQYFGFNTTIPPFNNPKVRQAINWAIDRDTIVKLILNERAKVAYGVLPPGILGYNKDIKGYTFDQKKAAGLLAEAGFPEGKGFPEITLQTNRDSRHSRIGEFILANLRDIGINCTLKEVEFNEHMEGVVHGQVPFFRMGWSVDYPDPDNLLHTLFHSSNIGAPGNFAWYTNPEVDDLLNQARFEIDPQKRKALYQEAEKLIVKDAPWVFLYHYTAHLLSQPNVRGLVVTPMGTSFINYRKLWFSGKKEK